MEKVWLAIIAGGQGERLFPLSNETCPKQFCQLDEGNTFIQATARRFGIKPNRIIAITTNKNQTALAYEQLSSLGVPSTNIYQIAPHYDYAGAMVKAAEFIKKFDKHATIINTPADHYVVADDEFKATVTSAIKTAQEGFPTIVGVKISDLNMVMGCGHAIYDEEENVDHGIYTVEGFVEKPDRKTAANIEDCAVVATSINDQIVLVVAKLEASQDVKILASNYKKLRVLKNFNRFSVMPNNRVIIMNSDFSKEVKVGYLGIESLLVYTHKNKDGSIVVAISGQHLGI